MNKQQTKRLARVVDATAAGSFGVGAATWAIGNPNAAMAITVVSVFGFAFRVLLEMRIGLFEALEAIDECSAIAEKHFERLERETAAQLFRSGGNGVA